jgi:hypothetical protein
MRLTTTDWLMTWLTVAMSVGDSRNPVPMPASAQLSVSMRTT